MRARSHPSVPIIFVTAVPTSSARVQGYDLGAVDFCISRGSAHLRSKVKVLSAVPAAAQLADQRQALTETLRMNAMFRHLEPHLRNP